MRIPAPNFTATPNDLFDEWLPILSHVELKVLMVIMRKTFGWHKIRDRISLTQLEKITGSKRSAIIKATKNLQKLGLIFKEVVGEKGSQNTVYELIIIEDSNNSYQSPDETPPSLPGRPTKETLTKETKEKKERDASVQPPIFLFFNRVKIEEKDYEKLVKEFGQSKFLEMIDRLEEYADINPKRFKQYGNHATIIRKWIREDEQKPANKKENQSKKNQEWAKKVIKLSGLNDKIEAYDEYIVFRGIGPAPDIVIKFSEHGFKEQVINRLRKMGFKLENDFN